jgi:hypothetical protein
VICGRDLEGVPEAAGDADVDLVPEERDPRA